MRADCSGSIFPLVTADTNKSPAYDRVAAAGSHCLKVFFFVLLPREPLKSVPQAEFHIKCIVLSD